MNYTQDGVYSLDLQSVAKRIYESLLYNSQFYKFLNPNYIGELRTAGTPMIEILKSGEATVNVRSTKEITNALTPGLLGYSSQKVDLTELPMDYSIRIPVLVSGTNFINTLEDAMAKKDQAVAKRVDTYGFGTVLANGVTQEAEWDPATQADYIELLNNLKATLFNKLDDVKGYFYNPLAVVGDSFFDSFVEYNNNYPGFPGYYVMEGNIMFGAKVVETDAIIKLVEEISA